MSFLLCKLLNLLSRLPPELAHEITIIALQFMSTILSQECKNNSNNKDSNIKYFGLHFKNCLGVAAGFDKDARAYPMLWKQGFAFVEVGTVTPMPQEGNPKPRLFRLYSDRAIVNRMGFNSQGMEKIAKRLMQEKKRSGILGINIGPNKASTDPSQDYQRLIVTLAPFADYFAVNLSSPNTPGLRSLQVGCALNLLLKKIQKTRSIILEQYGLSPPILLKIAPDWDDDDQLYRLIDTAEAYNIDGLIISNTTTRRYQKLKSINATEKGGLSGVPLFVASTTTLAKAFCYLQGIMPLIGVGGVFNNFSVSLKMQAGASLVQVYTGLIYNKDNFITQLRQKNTGNNVFCELATKHNKAITGSRSYEFCNVKNLEEAMKTL